MSRRGVGKTAYRFAALLPANHHHLSGTDIDATEVHCRSPVVLGWTGLPAHGNSPADLECAGFVPRILPGIGRVRAGGRSEARLTPLPACLRDGRPSRRTPYLQFPLNTELPAAGNSKQHTRDGTALTDPREPRRGSSDDGSRRAATRFSSALKYLEMTFSPASETGLE